MRPFEIMDTSTLLDALAEYTARSTRILAGGGKEKDMVNCQETIQPLISEIELRKKSTATNEPASNEER